MKYIKLLKLMYLADRLAFVDSGYPITGAKMVSMDKGPVLSEVYTQITWGDGPETEWNQLVAREGPYDVEARQPGTELLFLSDYDEEILGRVHDKFGDWDAWDLVRYTHTLVEWKDPDGSSLPIDARLILEDAGKSDDEIHGIAAQVECIRAMRASSTIVG